MTRSRDTANIIPTVDAKGDLIVGSADNTVAKLAVGAEGTVLLADPSTPTGLAWGAAGGSISVSTTAPADPSEGDLWFNSANATTYIYYDSFWVEVSEAKLGPTGLPGVVIQDGQPTDSNVLWFDTNEEASAPIPVGGTSGQILQKTSSNDYETGWANPPSGNAIINGGMEIWQRGTSIGPLSSTTTYVADRWYAYLGATPFTYSRQASGLDGIQYAMRMQRTSGNTGTNTSFVVTAMETVNSIPLAGKSVTLSFYARAGANYSAASGALQYVLKSGTGTDQKHDSYTGGVDLIDQTATLTTSWQRFTYTATVGTTATELAVLFHTTPVGTAGANDWFEVTGVQLESGSTATPFRRNANSIAGELAACKRYFERHVNEAPGATGQIDVGNRPEWVVYYEEKRVAPSITVVDPTNIRWVSLTSSSSVATTAFQGTLSGTVNKQSRLFFTVSSGISAYTLWTLENTGPFSIDISAEL